MAKNSGGDIQLEGEMKQEHSESFTGEYLGIFSLLEEKGR